MLPIGKRSARGWVWLALLATSALLLAACAAGNDTDEGGAAAPPDAGPASDDMGMGDDNEMGGEMMGDAEDTGMGHDEEDMHDESMHVDPPPEYAGLTNPHEGDPQAIAAGEEIFQTNCASCHGEQGRGDGPAAQGLDPAPASLADQAMMHDLTDGFLFWRVTEGGLMEPFNSAMPAWGDILTEDERWQVISYIRTLGE